MREARDRFLAQNGFDLNSYSTPGLPLHLGRWNLVVPNPGVLAFHDLHHVATGYPATVVGEAEISVFELRGGCPVPLVRLLCVGAVACGLLLAPRRIKRAWHSAQGARTLYDRAVPYQTLLDMTVTQLRQHLRLEETSHA